jgi:uncharacterized protein with GYD domain
MATYIVLAQYTQKGVENIKQSPARLDATKKAFKAMGAELKEFYLVSGRYDMVVIAEAPNYETVSKIALSIGSQDSVHTETISAFTEDEYRKIISELP